MPRRRPTSAARCSLVTPEQLRREDGRACISCRGRLDGTLRWTERSLPLHGFCLRYFRASSPSVGRKKNNLNFKKSSNPRTVYKVSGRCCRKSTKRRYSRSWWSSLSSFAMKSRTKRHGRLGHPSISLRCFSSSCSRLCLAGLRSFGPWGYTCSWCPTHQFYRWGRAGKTRLSDSHSKVGRRSRPRFRKTRTSPHRAWRTSSCYSCSRHALVSTFGPEKLRRRAYGNCNYLR